MEIGRASAWLEERGREQAVPAEEVARLDLCLIEAVANVLKYGGAEAEQSDICLGLKVTRSGGTHTAQLAVTDGGTPFNPLDHVTRLHPTSFAEAEPGGLGIAMMRIHSDKLEYQFLDGRNQLGVFVNWRSCATDTATKPAKFQVQPFRRSGERRLNGGMAGGLAACAGTLRREERRTLGVGWISLFRDVDEHAVHQALEEAEVLMLPAGTPLLKPGEFNQSVFILLSGDVTANLNSDLSPQACLLYTSDAADE